MGEGRWGGGEDGAGPLAWVGGAGRPHERGEIRCFFDLQVGARTAGRAFLPYLQNSCSSLGSLAPARPEAFTIGGTRGFCLVANLGPLGRPAYGMTVAPGWRKGEGELEGEGSLVVDA